MIYEIIGLITIVSTVCWAINWNRKRLKIEVMEHVGEEWDVLKSNLFLHDNSLGLRISVPGCLLYSGIKGGYYHNHPGYMHSLEERHGWCDTFAKEIEDAMRQHLREVSSEKEIRKIIEGAYKQARKRREVSV